MENELEKKIEQMMDAFQSFGLNVIQSLGETKHVIERLDGRIEELEKTIVNLKDIEVNLQGLTKFKSENMTEIAEIKSMLRILISNRSQIGEQEIANPNDVELEGLENPRKILEYFLEKVPKVPKHSELIELLQDTKEHMFLITGGHSVIFQMDQQLLKLKNDKGSLEEIQSSLQKSTKQWLERF